MRRTTAFLLVLVGVIAAALSVANRKVVSLSLDPFSDTHPALALDMPLYLLLFAMLFVGILLGALTVSLGRIRLWPDKKKPAPKREENEVRALQTMTSAKREGTE